MAIELELSKKGNHIKVSDVTIVRRVKVVKVGFIELAEDEATAAKADRNAFNELLKAETEFYKLGSAFTTTKEVAGEDVATGKLYEVLVS